MTGKYTVKEKIALSITLILIIASIIIHDHITTNADNGTTVITGFVTILLFMILLVCGWFPADIKMTDKQRAKVKDFEKLQNNYRRAIVIANFILCLMLDIMIVFVG